MAPARAVALALLASVASAGCVERTLALRSDPEGLEVSVNGVPAGRTPVDVPFTWYGTVRLETRPADLDGDHWPEVRRLVTSADLDTPWYECFPLDFFSENLVPFRIQDRHEVLLRPEIVPEPKGEAVEALRREMQPLRDRAEGARKEAEAQSEADRKPAEAKPK